MVLRREYGDMLIQPEEGKGVFNFDFEDLGFK